MDSSDESTQNVPDKGTTELIAGGALGGLTVCEAAAGVAVCPIYVIVAPILVGVGVVKRIKSRNRLKL
jgi:hypothetical protein